MSLSLKILLRWTIASMQMSAGIYRSRLNTLAVKGQSVILMYHRVINPYDATGYVEPGMFVTPAAFKVHLKLLVKYFNVVSLQEIISSSIAKSEKPLCAITFDDGWLDFYTNAYPLLQECGLPATVFLPTDFIGTDQLFWTDRLAGILKDIPSSPIKNSTGPDNGLISKIVEPSGTLFSRVDRAIKLLKHCSQEKIQEILQKIEIVFKVNDKNHQRAFLNWEECRKLKADGLVSFGSHTAQHIILTAETECLCRQELMNSRMKLIEEHAVDSTFIPFCYPNGGFSKNTAQLVEKSGYSCAVTTKRGYNQISDTHNLFTLNRVGMHQDMTANKSLALARIAGK